MQELSSTNQARETEASGELPVHQTFWKVKRPKNKPKRIRRKGKRTLEYEKWRDTVAIPYLDSTYGRKCADCGAVDGLSVDHIKNRGSRPDLVMELSNVQYLCWNCHRDKTDHTGRYR